MTRSAARTSRVEEDYLRLIWKAQEWEQRGATPAELSAATGTVPSAVTGALARLAKRGLIEHEPYGPATLTEAGRRLAVPMVRRHRLIETLLVERFGYTWDEVDEEAELLEHAISDRFLDRIDAMLGFPAHDPHGDPIPDRAGRVDRPATIRLRDLPDGQTAEVVRVSDHDPALLRYFAELGIVPGARVQILARREFAASVAVVVGGTSRELSLVAAGSVWTTDPGDGPDPRPAG
ncbi:metal-dependent transcriptional regulator [Granulicoccus phenolivorans]|uniref:metal-dependent transcriptional regulator n=1 Tax=Granulicoccus phenolivorans TaxID=266854 RepID=UPI0003FE080A|nr:metal-dependent transcriptional regulator [Granulicoccus phenolivorans]